MTPENSQLFPELDAMKALALALEPLDHASQIRVLEWLVNRNKLPVAIVSKRPALRTSTDR